MLTPPSFSYVIRVLKEIREGLVSIAREHYNITTTTKGGSSSSSNNNDAKRREADLLEAEINSIIDVEHINQQLLSEVFDWGSFSQLAQSIVSVIERLHLDPKCIEETRANFAALRLEIIIIIQKQQQLEEDDDIHNNNQNHNNNNDWQYVLCKAIRFLSDRLDVLRIETANRRCASSSSLLSSGTSSSFSSSSSSSATNNIIIIVFCHY